MPSSPSNTTKAVETYPKDKDDTAELVRFRQEWFAELHRRKAGSSAVTSTTAISPESTQQSQPPVSGTKDPIGHTFKESESALEATSTSSGKALSSRRNLATHPAFNEDGRITSPFQISKALESALNIYRRAIEHEQRSELDQALLLYRQAFRLVCSRVSQ